MMKGCSQPEIPGNIVHDYEVPRAVRDYCDEYYWRVLCLCKYYVHSGLYNSKKFSSLNTAIATIHEPSQTVYPNRFCQVLDRLKTDAAEEVSFTHDLNAAVRKLRYLHTLQASAGAVG